METTERWADIIDRASAPMSEEWRRRMFKELIRRVVTEEREACAKIADRSEADSWCMTCSRPAQIAVAIRARA